MFEIIRKGVAWLNQRLNPDTQESHNQENALYNDLSYLEQEIVRWRYSPERQMQITGSKYYLNHHNILHRKRTVIGEGGELVEVHNLPNNKVIHNLYAKMVDQKANYLVGKPLAFKTDKKNDPYLAELNKIFNKSFYQKLKNVAVDCFNGGISWLYPYVENNCLKVKRFASYEVLPFWDDADHTELRFALRLYETIETDKHHNRVTVERVEVYTPKGIKRYLLKDGRLILDPKKPTEDYLKYKDIEMNWERVPLIPFKYNSQEVPLIKRVKSLQDGINQILSDFENNMQEDCRNTIMVLVNYEGEDLGDFRHNLATYGAVKVFSDSGGNGDVKTLSIAVNAENYKAILDEFKRALIENARGYDAKDDRLGGQPNELNIQSMYSDIDLDANGMETEWQASFENLLWYVDTYLNSLGKPTGNEQIVTVIFNRDILINESEAIANCRASQGVISDETIIANHPWSDDQEVERVKKQRQTEQEEIDNYSGAFQQKKQGGINE